MKEIIIVGIAGLLMAFSPCRAQEKETATYAVYPYQETESGKTEWNITLPEKADDTFESFIDQAVKNNSPFGAANLVLHHDGKSRYYEEAQGKFNLWGYREAQVVHAFETPVTNLTSLWEQNFTAIQLTFFGKRNQTSQSKQIAKGTLNIGAEKAEVALIKTVEEITETALKPYRKVRVCHYFMDNKSNLPLFETVTDTLYTDGGAEKRVISFSLYRNQLITGTENISSSGHLKVYPNPTKGEFWLESNHTEASVVEIYDFTGKLQKTFPITNGCSELSISDLPTGTYMLKHLSRSSQVCIKLIKL